MSHTYHKINGVQLNQYIEVQKIMAMVFQTLAAQQNIINYNWMLIN